MKQFVLLCFLFSVLFRCSQVAQVLLTLPYSFSQLGMLSGVLLQIFYGILGSWTAYLISVLYVEYRTRKEKENVSFKNHVIQVVVFTFQEKENNFETNFQEFLQNMNIPSLLSFL